MASHRVVCVCKEIQIKAQKTYFCTSKLNGLYHLCHIYNNSPYSIALLTLLTLNLFLVSHVTTISTLTTDIQTKLPLLSIQGNEKYKLSYWYRNRTLNNKTMSNRPKPFESYQTPWVTIKSTQKLIHHRSSLYLKCHLTPPHSRQPPPPWKHPTTPTFSDPPKELRSLSVNHRLW